ncbi:MAG: nucleotidyltransferase domain-containing protein [bacterium]
MSTLQIDYDFDRIDRRTGTISPSLINVIKNRIVQFYRPDKIILFGSCATKNTFTDSDIDLFIVLNDHHPFSSKKRHERMGELLELFRYRSFALNSIVMTNSEIKKLIHTNEGEWDFILEILEKGKTLYDRPEKTNIE